MKNYSRICGHGAELECAENPFKSDFGASLRFQLFNLGGGTKSSSSSSQDTGTADNGALAVKQGNKSFLVAPGATYLQAGKDLTIATDQGAVNAGFNLANQAIALVENGSTVAAGSTADALSQQNDLLKKFVEAAAANSAGGAQVDTGKNFVWVITAAVIGVVVIVLGAISIFKKHKA